MIRFISTLVFAPLPHIHTPDCNCIIPLLTQSPPIIACSGEVPPLLHQLRCNHKFHCIAMTQGLHVRAMRPSLLSSLTPRHATPFLSPPSIIHHTYHSSPPCALCGTPPSIQRHGLNVPRCVVGSLSLANSNGSTPPLSQSPTHTTLPTPYYYAVHTTRVPPSCIIATTSNESTHDINFTALQ